MEAVKGYVMCALMASALSGIIKNLSSGMRGFDKYIGFVCSLVTVIMLATPFVKILPELGKAFSESTPEIPENSENISEENTDKTMLRYYEKALEDSLKSIISGKFSLDKDSFTLSVKIERDENGQYFVAGATLNIRSDADIDTNALKKYAEEILLTKIEVSEILQNEK